MYSGGTGIEYDPYQIANATDLANVSSNMSSYFLQTADITLGTLDAIGGNGASAPTPFTGFYDGAGYKIKDGSITCGSYANYWGLFCKVASTIKPSLQDIHLENVSISGHGYTGLICGQISNSGIYKCTTDANCSVNSNGNYVGGLVGGSNIGSSTDLSVSKCYNMASVMSTGNYIGGIIGTILSGYLLNCYNTGVVQGTTYVGGIVGYIATTAYNTYVYYCYNSGDITAVSYGGGISGYNSQGTAGLYCKYNYGLNNNIIATPVVVANETHAAGNFTLTHKPVVPGTDAFYSGANKTGTHWIKGVNYSLVDLTGVVTNINMTGTVYCNYSYTGTTFGRVCPYTGGCDTKDYGYVDMIMPAGITLQNTLTGRDGADITLADAEKQATYEANSWLFWGPDFGVWIIDEDSSFPYHNYTPYSSTTFPAQAKTLSGKDGADITLADAEKQASYTGNGWDFDNVWTIEEDTTFPFIGILEESPLNTKIKYWTGSLTFEMISKDRIKYWTGSAWAAVTDVKYWNGATWVSLYL